MLSSGEGVYSSQIDVGEETVVKNKEKTEKLEDWRQAGILVAMTLKASILGSSLF